MGPTRLESGCINYDLHQGVDDQSAFMFYENWTGKQDLDEHLAKPYLKAFMEKTKGILEEPPEIILWDMIS